MECCEAVGCGEALGVKFFVLHQGRFCTQHADGIATIRRHLQVAKKRKKIYLLHHLRLHEQHLRGANTQHLHRTGELAEVIMQRQGFICSCLCVCPLEPCTLRLEFPCQGHVQQKAPIGKPWETEMDPVGKPLEVEPVSSRHRRCRRA